MHMNSPDNLGLPELPRGWPYETHRHHRIQRKWPWKQKIEWVKMKTSNEMGENNLPPAVQRYAFYKWHRHRTLSSLGLNTDRNRQWRDSTNTTISVFQWKNCGTWYRKANAAGYESNEQKGLRVERAECSLPEEKRNHHNDKKIERCSRCSVEYRSLPLAFTNHNSN